MKIRHLALVAAISLAGSGASLAQQSSFTNTNTNSNNNAAFATGTTNSFSMRNGNMVLSQSGANAADSSGFCQFFSFSFGMTRIIQIIQGNSVSQIFGSVNDPVDDPCI